MKRRRKTQEEKQFGVSPNSIDSTLHAQPSELRERYRRNRLRFEADQAAMRHWARSGFVSDGTSVDDDEQEEAA